VKLVRGKQLKLDQAIAHHQAVLLNTKGQFSGVTAILQAMKAQTVRM
jgi:hypothetical protein